jgi:hypothetical protein
MPHYRTRQARAETVEAAVLELWRQSRHDQSEIEDTFRWYYRSDTRRDNRCFVVECHDEPACRLVGATGLGMRQFRVGQDRVRAGLLGDFFVDRAHRSLFPALSLQRAALEVARSTSAFVYGFPNPKALPVFRRLGFAELGTVTRWVRVLDYGPYLERRLRTPRVARGAAHFLNGLSRLTLPGWPFGFGGKYSWLARFDTRFDELNRASRLNLRVRGERDASFLNWRFVSKPGPPARIFTCSRHEDGGVRGYAVVELQADVAHVRDVFGENWAALAHLLRRLESELRDRGVRSINCNALHPSALSALLVRLGYVAREPSRQVILSATASDAASLDGPTAWHLTDADEDQ